MASSLRNGDIVSLLGGLFFLLACVAFLASYVSTRKDQYGVCWNGEARSGSRHTEKPSPYVIPAGPLPGKRESTACPGYASPWAASIFLNTLSHSL
jgi:hypothetical protein